MKALSHTRTETHTKFNTQGKSKETNEIEEAKFKRPIADCVSVLRAFQKSAEDKDRLYNSYALSVQKTEESEALTTEALLATCETFLSLSVVLSRCIVSVQAACVPTMEEERNTKDKDV